MFLSRILTVPFESPHCIVVSAPLVSEMPSLVPEIDTSVAEMVALVFPLILTSVGERDIRLVFVPLLPARRICVELILARVLGFQVSISPELFVSIDHQNRSIFSWSCKIVDFMLLKLQENKTCILFKHFGILFLKNNGGD